MGFYEKRRQPLKYKERRIAMNNQYKREELNQKIIDIQINIRNKRIILIRASQIEKKRITNTKKEPEQENSFNE